MSPGPAGTPHTPILPVAHVVVGLPISRVFSYVVPPELDGRIVPGQRVRVPFRGRGRTGIVVGVTHADASGLESVEASLDPMPALTPGLLDVARWAAEETASAWGEALVRALPPGARVAAPPALPAEFARQPPGSITVGYGAGRARLVEAAAERALGLGCAVLILAPGIEVARTWAGRLRGSLGEPVALVTSEESPRRRWETWWACRRHATRVAVGTRVAALLPVGPLGVSVVVDEEDPAHKAPDAPRWHARELALRRCHVEGGACLLTSAAPSLESWVRVQAGEATAKEAKDGAWPSVHCVDLRAASPAASLSPALREAVRETLARRRSVLLLLNRLGYGRVLGCAECGTVRRCPGCRVALTYHREARTMTCRLCGATTPAPSLCGRCRGRRLRPFGWGTERLEAEARAAFPGSRVVRYDSTVGPEAAAAARAAFRRGEAHVLVGTQMAVRLLEDRRVGLAALVLADVTLNLPDFRAAERTFQLGWRLAEGAEPGGSLWLQSFYPDHPALEAVVAGVREPFYHREWAERQELGYPPARRMARLLARGRNALRLVEDLAARGRAEGLTVLGPAVLAAGRAQVLLLGDAGLSHALAEVLGPLAARRRLGAVHLAVDVDPVELP